MTEEWRPCVGHPGYEVSDRGRVRSLPRVIPVTKKMPPSGRVATIDKFFKGRVLRPGRSNSGHLLVALSGKTFKVHRLVLEAFVGPCPDGMEGCHWDDVPGNNDLGNLRWDTHKENTEDAKRNGRLDARECRRLEFGGETLALAAWAERLGISYQSLRRRLDCWPLERALSAPRGKTGPRKIIAGSRGVPAYAEAQ